MQATNPENGTVTHTYNGYGKLATKVDAKNQKVAYTYARLTKVQRYPVSTGSEDICQQENYYYDTNPFDGGTYSFYTAGSIGLTITLADITEEKSGPGACPLLGPYPTIGNPSTLPTLSHSTIVAKRRGRPAIDGNDGTMGLSDDLFAERFHASAGAAFCG